MESHPDGPLLPLPFQIVALAILIPVESFLAAHITQMVCDYLDIYKRMSVTSDNVLLFGFLLLPFAFVTWLKDRAGIWWVLILISSLLVILSVCLDVWHLHSY